MIDVPKLGLDLLNRALSHVAEGSDDPGEYEDSEALIESLRGMVGHTELREALTELAESHDDQLRREHDVIESTMKVEHVKRMGRR